MDLLNAMKNRRSVRSYAEGAISDEDLTKILQAGLLAPSSGGIRPWELIVIRDREMLRRLARARNGSIRMLEHAAAAVAVIADTERSGVWVEDCSVVMANMHLMADHLGVGSCWIQGRLRDAGDGRTLDACVRDSLGYPGRMELEAILSLGIPEEHPPGRELSDLPVEKLHWETY